MLDVSFFFTGRILRVVMVMWLPVQNWSAIFHFTLSDNNQPPHTHITIRINSYNKHPHFQICLPPYWTALHSTSEGCLLIMCCWNNRYYFASYNFIVSQHVHTRELPFTLREKYNFPYFSWKSEPVKFRWDQDTQKVDASRPCEAHLLSACCPFFHHLSACSVNTCGAWGSHSSWP